MVSYRIPPPCARRLARRADAARAAHLALAARVHGVRRAGARRGERVGGEGRDQRRRVRRRDRAARAGASPPVRLARRARGPARCGRRGARGCRLAYAASCRARDARDARRGRRPRNQLHPPARRRRRGRQLSRRSCAARSSHASAKGVDARRRLLPVPVARVRNVLSDFRREAEALGAERTLAVATSAVRDAENGEAFLGEVEWSYGFATRLLSGDEEAALTRAGVGRVAAGTLLLDVGGGSTELVADESRTSLDIGSVRVTERHLHSDPPTGAELATAAAAVREPPSPARAYERQSASQAPSASSRCCSATERCAWTRVEALLERLAAMTARGAARAAWSRPGQGARDRRRRTDRARGAALLRPATRSSSASVTCSTAQPSQQPTCPPQDEGAAPPGAYTCC